MISKIDIEHFFDIEASSSKKSWESMMALPLHERIRRRRAIERVKLIGEESSSEQGYVSIKVYAEVNLSDFKEGDSLLLHRENKLSGIHCTLASFVGDTEMVLDIYGCPDFSAYYNVPLLLDKDCIDLRDKVYNKFLTRLPADSDFWSGNVLNSGKPPVFSDESKNDEELQDTIENFHLTLKPKQREAVLKCMSANDYYLILGPPGTGKSFVLSLVILEELLYFRHKVIVTGPNHKAINNTLEAVARIIPDYLCHIVKIGQSYNAPTIEIERGEERLGILNVSKSSWCLLDGTCIDYYDGPLVIGLTPHSLYTSRGGELTYCDTIIIDEAGQMSIPLALMGMIKARKVIFAGDYKQLPPIVPSQEITGEMQMSAFQKLISDTNCTMLDTSFRMCEPLCNFISELFYDGKVVPEVKGHGMSVLCPNQQYSYESPIIINDVEDDGEQTSDKESSFITELISVYINTYHLSPLEIAVLSPFRAQAAYIRRHLRKSKTLDQQTCQKIAVDTVDKMQGQEREVIIYSMTAGDPDYIADMDEFLFNPNKLNVAFSRAKFKLIIVGNMKQLKKADTTDYPHIRRMIESEFVKHL